MSSDRFGRKYELEIQVDGQVITIVPEIKIIFRCDKSSLFGRGLNKLNIEIYNLKPSTRLAIVKDREQISKIIPISLKIGYEGQGLGIIFKGTILSCSNDKKGTDFVSYIECLDGGFGLQNSFTSATVGTKREAIEKLISDYNNVNRGFVEPQNEIIRPRVMVGNTRQLLGSVSGSDKDVFIDNEQVYILKNNQVRGELIPDVNSQTGLLNTPERQYQRVIFTTMINPTLLIAGRCNLQSGDAPYLNGIYKMQSISYVGNSFDGKEWYQTITAFKRTDYEVINENSNA